MPVVAEDKPTGASPVEHNAPSDCVHRVLTADANAQFLGHAKFPVPLWIQKLQDRFAMEHALMSTVEFARRRRRGAVAQIRCATAQPVMRLQNYRAIA